MKMVWEGDQQNEDNEKGADIRKMYENGRAPKYCTECFSWVNIGRFNGEHGMCWDCSDRLGCTVTLDDDDDDLVIF